MNKVTIDRDRGAPLHHQIYLVLADGIATGRYAIGEPLPTEEQLTQIFSVSRITVRRAMTSLQNDGLIERGAGRRTIVRPPIGQPLSVPATSVIENIAAYGAETVATVLEFDYVPAPGFLRDRLWDARDNPVQRAVRVSWRGPARTFRGARRSSRRPWPIRWWPRGWGSRSARRCSRRAA